MAGCQYCYAILLVSGAVFVTLKLNLNPAPATTKDAKRPGAVPVDENKLWK